MSRILLTTPRFVEPMVPVLADAAPTGGDWLHEIKYDGYRTLVGIDGERTRAWSRTGLDWSAAYAPIVAAARELKCRTALIDGEVAVQDERGVTDFAALRSAIRWQPQRLVFFAFDLLMLDGEDLRLLQLEERRRRLESLIAGGNGVVQFSPHLVGDGTAIFAEADRLGLEGIVSKRAGSIYRSGRRGDAWVKTKCFTESDFEIVGVEATNDGAPIALLAAREDQLRYVGNAMIGLGGRERSEFWKRIEALGTPQSRLKGFGNRKALWINEGLRARVRHLRGEQKLRHATVRAVTME